MKRLYGLLIGVFLGCGTGVVQAALEEVPPEQIGLSEEKLERVTALLQAHVKRGEVAGAVGMVLRHGRIGYWTAAGFADLEGGQEMKPDTLFRIASMTKPVTSVAVMMLVEEGALALEDSVSRYLPEFEGARVLPRTVPEVELTEENLEEAERPVTIHDLLTHTSGITYGWSGPPALDAAFEAAGFKRIFMPSHETIAAWSERIAGIPLKFQPGTEWDYGLGLDVVGRVIEVASGLPLDIFFRERIFRPLQMDDTFFFVPEGELDRVAALYTPGENQQVRKVPAEGMEAGILHFSPAYPYGGDRSLFSGGGGLVSSAGDYARFLQMLLNGGSLEGVNLLRPETVERMRQNQIGEMQLPFGGHGDGFGYGFGVLTERGVPEDAARVGTYSWGGIFNTYFWVDPQEELVGILMTQLFPYGHLTLRTDFKERVYEALDDSGFETWQWYEKGSENGNPFFNSRQLRVNAPPTSLHPNFGGRSEARSAGLMRIHTDEDLREVRRAAVYQEVWGGHPGTANKRMGVNGRNVYFLPHVGTEERHCTHQYPIIALNLTDLVRGYNALQFACDEGATFWGHFIVDNAAIRLGLKLDHGLVGELGLEGFSPAIQVRSEEGQVRMQLPVSEREAMAIEEVVYQGHYHGFDENGDGWERDWHGMSKGKEPMAWLGSAKEAPYALCWDTSMLPDQERVQVRAMIRFRSRTELTYTTEATAGFSISAGARVSLHKVKELPKPFWSRAGRRVTAELELEIPVEQIERAELHVVSWTGGAGTVQEYFTLNGQPLPVAEGGGHEVNYSVVPVEPAWLREGANRIELLSDTDHHGIEVLKPGPVLVVRRGN